MPRSLFAVKDSSTRRVIKVRIVIDLQDGERIGPVEYTGLLPNAVSALARKEHTLYEAGKKGEGRIETLEGRWLFKNRF